MIYHISSLTLYYEVHFIDYVLSNLFFPANHRILKGVWCVVVIPLDLPLRFPILEVQDTIVTGYM